jgi:hypothetical protein
MQLDHVTITSNLERLRNEIFKFTKEKAFLESKSMRATILLSTFAGFVSRDVGSDILPRALRLQFSNACERRSA